MVHLNRLKARVIEGEKLRDKTIKKMYDEKKSSVDKLESELEVLRKQKHDASKESEMISTVGVKKLQTLIEKVNDKFSSYFADLGYAGQVVGYNVQLKHRSCREVHLLSCLPSTGLFEQKRRDRLQVLRSVHQGQVQGRD